MIGVIMFIVCLAALLIGFPVAFTFGGIALIFALFAPDGINLFAFMPYRIMSVMQNTILMAVPLFVFMGVVLQKTQLAKNLLEAMNELFSGVRGGLAVSTILIGSLLAASTGVVGASVVVMGIISLPVMLKHKVHKQFASGIVCASGTLGQIVPPSIVLVILADVLGLPVGDLFHAAILPSVILIGAYILYALIYSYFNDAKTIQSSIKKTKAETLALSLKLLKAIIPALSLIILVLGSILTGIATPTESASIGAVGSIVLAIIYKKFNLSILKESSIETIKTTAMVFTILIGATAFSMVFSYTGGDVVVEKLIHSLPAKEWSFIILSMILILILGFFIDFIEISLIIVPILYPIAQSLGVDMTWFAILLAMNLQTSFLTPPFGFSLFYLKGVAPKNVQTLDIYKGVVPFILIQITVLASIMIFPSWYGFTPVL